MPAPPSGREWANLEGVRMNPGIWILPLPSANAFLEGGWAGTDPGNFLSLGWETILEGDEPQVGQWHEDVERKREYYHIIIFPETNWNFTSKKKRSSENHSSLTEHFNGILFHKSEPANK